MAALDYLHLSRPPEKSSPPALERLTVAGGYHTALMVHLPPRRRHLPVLLLHGIQSHPGWFSGSADALAGEGFPVYQFQRRGSGSNAKDRGHADSAAQLLEDLHLAVSHVLARQSVQRLHLMGVSWGGKYAACYCLDSRRASVVSSLTLVAPGLVSRVDLSAMAKLRVAVCAALAPKRLFDIPLNEPELFTDNPRLREYITTDAHRLHKASARFLLASRRMDRMLAAAGDGTLRLPVQLLLAQRDRIINNEATQALLSRLAGERLQVRQFPAAHTIEFEADPQPFYRALMEWLAAHE